MQRLRLRSGRRAVRVEPVAGAYNQQRCWWGLDHFLDVVVPTALDLVGAEALCTGGRRVTRATFEGWVRIEAHGADYSTGRGVELDVARVAELLGRDERTVQRCRAIACSLGLYVIVLDGRHLRLDERLRAWEAGSSQRGLANTACFTIPDWLQPHLRRCQEAYSERPLRLEKV